MPIRRAVITAAAPNQNRLPLQQLVDRDGQEKTALQLIIEETVAAGIDEVCVIIQPGDTESYQAAAGTQVANLHFIEQPEPLGYADAVYREIVRRWATISAPCGRPPVPEQHRCSMCQTASANGQ